MQLKAVLIEDEQDAMERIKLEIAAIPQIDVVAEAFDIDNGEKEILLHRPDLVFMDIMLRGRSVFDMIRNLKKRSLSFGIIFITGYYNEYEEEAIDVCGVTHCFDYLPKPLNQEKLLKSLDKFKDYFQQIRVPENLVFQTRAGLERFSVKEILYCQSEGNYSTIFLEKNYSSLVTKMLGELKDLLPNHFYRMNRTNLINLEYFQQIKGHFPNKKCVLYKNGNTVELKIPDRKVPELIKAVDHYFRFKQ